jgi:hypothetical protein
MYAIGRLIMELFWRFWPPLILAEKDFKSSSKTPSAVFPDRRLFESDASFSANCSLVAHVVWSGMLLTAAI